MSRWMIGVVALVAAAVPSQAPAAVDIGTDQVVVTERDGGRVVVDRKPFRVRVEDARRTTVLAQVPNTGAAPLVIPPVPDPELIATDVSDRPTLYAPLTFTVGYERSAQHPAGQYQGDQITAAEVGTQYSARDVVAAEPAGEGARLTLSTNDPTGRRLVVTIAPDGTGAVRLGARPVPATDVVAMGNSFVTSRGEAFRGFGGRHNALDQHGEDFYNWLEEENFGCGVLQPVCDNLPGGQRERYMFPNGPHAAYYVQALFTSSRRYGFLLHQTELSRFRLASDREDAWQVWAAAPALDYTVAIGEPKKTISTLTAKTGRHRVPPAWAVGPMTSALIRPGQTPAEYEAQVRTDLRAIDRYKVPLDSYDLFGWTLLSRDKVRELVAEFHKRDIRVLGYFRAFPSPDPYQYEDRGIFEESIAKGYVATTPAGGPYLFGSPFIPTTPGVLIDFTNAEAVRWWKKRVRESLDLGLDGFMQDFGEQVMYDMRFADGSTGAQMHNRYPNLFHKATREEFDDYEREHPKRELFFYTRAGYTGTPGAAAYENANFPGDNETAFARSNGLASAAPDMLNRAVGGAFGFTTDIGGYGDYVTPPTTKELLLRWAQWASLSPLFRLHNTANAGTRQPWFFDDETVAIYSRYAQLHQDARRLIMRLWDEGVRTGIPPTRPMWLEFPGDPEAAKQDQQWMLGPDVLVAPIVEEGAQRRKVYFPEGCWQHGDTAWRFRGPASVEVAARLDSLPWFVRCGTDPLFGGRPASLGLPAAARKCRSRRSFAIRLRNPRGDRLVRARVLVNGRTFRTLRGRRLRSRVDLRGLPRGRYAVRVEGVGRSGRRYVATRRYRTCSSARRGGTPPRPRPAR